MKNMTTLQKFQQRAKRPMTAVRHGTIDVFPKLKVPPPTKTGTTTEPSTTKHLKKASIDLGVEQNRQDYPNSLLFPCKQNSNFEYPRSNLKKSLNEELSIAMETAIHQFKEKKKGNISRRFEPEEQEIDESKMVIEQEIFTREDYLALKQQAQDLSKELVETQRKIATQKTQIQRMNSVQNSLKTKVRDPIEVKIQYENMIEQFENELKEEQIRENRYRELYAEECSQFQSFQKIYKKILKEVLDNPEKNSDIRKLIQQTEELKTSSSKSQIGIIEEKYAAEISRLQHNAEQKQIEKHFLQKALASHQELYQLKRKHTQKPIKSSRPSKPSEPSKPDVSSNKKMKPSLSNSFLPTQSNSKKPSSSNIGKKIPTKNLKKSVSRPISVRGLIHT